MPNLSTGLPARRVSGAQPQQPRPGEGSSHALAGTEPLGTPDLDAVFGLSTQAPWIVAPVVAGSIPVIHPRKGRQSSMCSALARLVLLGLSPYNVGALEAADPPADGKLMWVSRAAITSCVIKILSREISELGAPVTQI